MRCSSSSQLTRDGFGLPRFPFGGGGGGPPPSYDSTSKRTSLSTSRALRIAW